jgi:hypothetical protein
VIVVVAVNPVQNPLPLPPMATTPTQNAVALLGLIFNLLEVFHPLFLTFLELFK